MARETAETAVGKGDQEVSSQQKTDRNARQKARK